MNKQQLYMFGGALLASTALSSSASAAIMCPSPGHTTPGHAPSLASSDAQPRRQSATTGHARRTPFRNPNGRSLGYIPTVISGTEEAGICPTHGHMDSGSLIITAAPGHLKS